MVLVSGQRTIVTAGVALTPGILIYLDANSKAQLAVCTNQVTAAAVGLTLGTVAANQAVVIAQAGAQVTLGANNCVTKGGVYHVSANAGGIAPEADFNAAQWVAQVGRAPNATDVVLELNVYGYTHG